MSNELPEDAVLLAAFYDRYPLKRVVNYVDDASFQHVLMASMAGTGIGSTPPVRLDANDLAELDRRRDAVKVSGTVLQTLQDIRKHLAAKKVMVSDRRWVQALNLMRAGAVLGGRTEVATKDLGVLKGVLWNTPEDCEIVNKIVEDYYSPLDRDLKELHQQLVAERQRIVDAVEKGQSNTGNGLMDVARNCGAARQRVVHAENKIRQLKTMVQQGTDDWQKICEVELMVNAFSHKIQQVLAGQANAETFRDLDLKKP
jgi:MoxR-like ATPase